MSSKRQITSKVDAGTGAPLGEGFVKLITSAGNGLVFRSPAEAYAYQQNNLTQVPSGTHDDRLKPPA